MFVAVGHTGLRLTSPDGEHWSEPVLGKTGETYRSVAIGAGRVAAVGSYGGNNIFASFDGRQWKPGTQDAQYSMFLRTVLWGKNEFLAAGGDPGAVGLARPFVQTSPDGVTWSDRINIEGKFMIRRIAVGGDLYVGVGDRGRRAASTDGKIWKDTPDVKPIDTLIDIAFGAGRFVGVGLHSLRMTSTDGVTWSERVVGEEGEHLNSIVWTGDRFVAVGAGVTMTSPDGLTWDRKPNEGAPVTMAYGDGQFVGSAWRGRLLLSDDGVRWRMTHRSEHHVEAIAWGAVG